jgi:hypothetical protein
LAGDGGPVIFNIRLKSETQQAVAEAQARITSQPWVQRLSIKPENGHLDWLVSVTDEAAAEDKLLGLILSDHSLKVMDFHRKTYNLEEVFMDLVEKENLK